MNHSRSVDIFASVLKAFALRRDWTRLELADRLPKYHDRSIAYAVEALYDAGVLDCVKEKRNDRMRNVYYFILEFPWMTSTTTPSSSSTAHFTSTSSPERRTTSSTHTGG
jgi:hypothetical protein